MPSSEICAGAVSGERAGDAHDVVVFGDVGEDLSARARTSGEVTPASEWTTIWTVSPARWGKLSCKVSAAALDSDPGCR